MRPPLTNPPRAFSAAVQITADIYQTQPFVAPPDASTSVPLGRLPITSGTFTDDATRVTPRTMHLETSSIPAFLQPGMWVVVTIGIQIMNPVIYRLSSMVIDDVTTSLDRLGGAAIDASDPTAVVNGRPHEKDTSLAGLTLQGLVNEAFATALSRPGFHAGVPTVALPVGSIAEFGVGRWDVCLRLADALGYDLHIDDMGDVTARDRTAPAPVPVADIERSLLPRGTRHFPRYPTDARLFVTRGSATPPLIGKSSIAALGMIPPPTWMRRWVITDRQEGFDWWTQGYADRAADAFLQSRLAELDHFDSLPILASPWLQPGVDTVTFYGVTYWLSAMTMQFPTMATTVDLRRVP